MAEISFSLAISWGEYEKVEELLSTPDGYNLATNEALIDAAKSGHLEIVDKLLNIPAVRNGIHRYDKEQNLLISETNRPVS